MRISVIIPTFRPADYIWTCLKSLSEQSLDHSLYEVIIVLNGPKDPYLAELQTGVKKRFPEMSCTILHTDSKGVSNARNMAIDICKSEYLCFVDDDDWVSTNYLEKLLDKADGNRIVVSNVLDYNETTKQLQDDYLTRSFRILGAGETVGLYTGRKFLSSSCCKIIPRRVIGNRRFDTHFAVGEDALFMAAISNHIQGVLLSDEDVVYYRRLRGMSASRKKRTRWQILCNSTKLSVCYLKIWASDIFHYSLPYILTRIAAVMLWIIKG